VQVSVIIFLFTKIVGCVCQHFTHGRPYETVAFNDRDFYRQDCRVAANCRYCFYSQAKKSGFSPHRGDSLHRFRSNFAGPMGTWVRLAVQNFMSIGAEGWECGPKISKISIFGKESPRRGDSLDRVPKFLGAFIHLTILR